MKDKNQIDSVETLIKIAGPRVKPDEDSYNEVYANVREVWRQQNNKSFYLQQRFKIAISMMLIVGTFTIAFFSIKDDKSIYQQISKNIILSGQIEISKNQLDWTHLKNNAQLTIGDYIRTNSNNRILVELVNGNSFRLDENSSIQLIDESNITLFHGQIYIESIEQKGQKKLIINTSYGSIKHIGTKYSIGIQPNYLNVNVRKGRIIFQNEKQIHEVEKGFGISVGNNGEVLKKPVSPQDKRWDWTQKIASHFSIQDKSIGQYLDWISKETGYPIVWDSPKIKNAATKITLSGSIKGLLPLESLDVILPTTNFNYKISKTSILISN